MECKSISSISSISKSLRFRLTIWNVNKFYSEKNSGGETSFRLTIWNVNLESKALNPSSFIVLD